MKRYVVLLAVAALMVAALAVPALAAPQGQVERGPAHAKSICSYSGLNDDPDDPVEGGQTQSYGQWSRRATSTRPTSRTRRGPACCATRTTSR